MAKNDVVLLDSIIENKMATDVLDRGEAFELFSFEQILKSYDLTREEIDFGWVDGRNDGGIDGFFVFLNGILLRNEANCVFPRKNIEFDVWVISCKHRDSFQQSPLNTIFPTIEELLDFTKESNEFKGEYSDQLQKIRQSLVYAFRQTASGLPRLNFKFAYSSRGDVVDLKTNIIARGEQLKRIVSDYFSDATVTLDFFGSTELIALHRKNKVVLELPYVEQLSSNEGAFVLLVKIDAYAQFVGDENKQLRRYLFDSNVRDFLGMSSVNQDIADTLDNGSSPNFWWLNNGITILATSAIPLGKTFCGNSIQLHDVQIVNGLQTTQSIFRHFSRDWSIEDNRCVLVKVIVSEDESVRDAIIKATNNQNQVELAALNATDRIQRDIEDILEKYDWYYERRKNYYKYIGKPAERFITPILLAVSFVALINKSPQKAGNLKSKFMRNRCSYEAVFSDKVQIHIWPHLAAIIKSVEFGMTRTLPSLNSLGRRVLGKWRGAVALCAVAKQIGTFDYSYSEFLDLDVDMLTPEFIGNIFSLLSQCYDSLHGASSVLTRHLNKLRRMDEACRLFGTNENISGVGIVGVWGGTNNVKINILTDDMIEKVSQLLPQQPWRKGIHVEISQKLQLKKSLVLEAIASLIRTGHFYNQIDGVVINSDGIVVNIDFSRGDMTYKIGDHYNF